MQTRFRKDWPRIVLLFGLFFLMGGYGHTALWLSGEAESMMYAISGIMAAMMLSVGVYFIVIMGRQIIRRGQTPYMSSLSKKLAT